MTSIYADVATRCGRALGVGVELVEGRDFEQLQDGSVDVAFLCGLAYVRLCPEGPGVLRPLAVPVLAEPRYEGRPVYFSDVIVREDSAVGSFGDLRGRRWAYNDPGSFSGWLLVRYHLRQMGETEAFFGRVEFSGRHQESIRLVLNGNVDASAIDSHVLGIEYMRNPDLARELRVIAVLGPSTIPPVVATAGVPAALQGRVRDALCALDSDPDSRHVLASGLIQRFTSIDDRAYDDIRQKVAALENSVPRGHQLTGLGA